MTALFNGPRYLDVCISRTEYLGLRFFDLYFPGLCFKGLNFREYQFYKSNFSCGLPF